MYWITLSMKCEGKTMTKQGLQILVTGGRPLEHTALMENLRAEGAIVSEATDFAAILQVSQNNMLDVLVLIEPLPYSGRLRQIVALLRAQNATTKLVILSTNEVPERVQATLKAGADGYVHKDETVATILHAIDAVVQGDIWVSPKLIRALTAGPTQQAQPQVNLTEREHQLLFLMVQGRTNAEIARSLSLTTQTVRNYCSRLYEKIGVHTHGEAIVWGIDHGFLTSGEAK